MQDMEKLDSVTLNLIRMPRVEFRNEIARLRALKQVSEEEIDRLKILRRKALSRDYSQRSRANKKQTIMQLEECATSTRDLMARLVAAIQEKAKQRFGDSGAAYQGFVQDLEELRTEFAATTDRVLAYKTDSQDPFDEEPIPDTDTP